LDGLVSAFREISDEAHSDPETVKGAPYSTAVRHLDEYRAAHPKTLTLSWRMFQKHEGIDA
jgi:glycine dehydrogenase subunit 2